MVKPWLVSALVVAGLSFAIPSGAQFSTPRADGGSNVGAAADRRQSLIDGIVAKWGAVVAETYRTDVDSWVASLSSLFANASPDALRKAADARTFTAMNDALLERDQEPSRLSSAGGVMTENAVARLGDAAADLTFVPVTPCRIIDTRVAGGVIAANSVRSFDVTSVSDYSAQGGDPSNCNGTGAAGSFAAAAINFTVVTPSSGGYITAFPFLGTQPLAATVNYAAGDIRGNLAIVKLDQSAAANEVSVYTFAQTHLVADIVGYFINPEPTPLECVEVESAGTNISAGSFGSQTTPQCPATYTITGGGCSMSTFDGRVVTSRSIVSGASQTHFCAFRNEGAATIEGVAYGRCCRVPGR